MSGLSRRRFVVGAGLAGAGLLAGCGRLPWPGQLLAQQPTRVPHVGMLVGPVAGVSTPGAAFRQALADLGYTEGANLRLELRVAEVAQLSEAAAELARLPLDVIYTAGPAQVRAVRDATSTIPIVMAYAGDPVADGMVASLARPGGNVTGVTIFVAQLTAKRMELLRDTLSGLSRVAVLSDPHRVNPRTELTEARNAAQALGVQVLVLEVADPPGLEMAFETAVRQRADAALLLNGVIFFENQAQTVDLALRYQMPTMYWTKKFVRYGGLMSYGADIASMQQRAAVYVDKILKGAQPTDLPVEQPMRFDFVVNMKTARALGITFPHEVALQITEVIE